MASPYIDWQPMASGNQFCQKVGSILAEAGALRGRQRRARSDLGCRNGRPDSSAHQVIADQYDIPYRFARAPRERVELLLERYADAAQASRQAADKVGKAAEIIRAPSRLLALARSAVTGSPAVLSHRQNTRRATAERMEGVPRGAGWAQQDVAEQVARLAWLRRRERVGVNPDMVAKWERGEKGPSPRYRDLLCLFFGTDVAALGIDHFRRDFGGRLTASRRC